MNGKIKDRDLKPMVDRLNAAAERLGMLSRYDVEAGSKSMGRAYVLSETHPYRGHPSRQAIGVTAAQADWWLEGMLRAFQAIQMEADDNDREEANARLRAGGFRDLVSSAAYRTGGSGASRVIPTHDPDARSARRSYE